MALIDALLDKISDHSLRQALREQVDAMLSKQSYGLVFQQHAPETVELPNYKVRRGCKVRIRSENDDALYRVESVKGQTGTVVSLNEVPERWDVPVDDLVVVREFGDPIYPGLRSTGTVDRGGDKPPHLVINAENFHALETLLYTHEGKIDAIYIDPPYNTRDKDWKYNNDYVDSDDVYRHSKWLAMMQRRLTLAKDLLNPEGSVLIVTIDEKECLRLGLLLQQMFPDARQQMISSVIKPSGSRRAAEFSRVEEYIFFVMLGCAMPVPWQTDMLRSSPTGDDAPAGASVTWHGLRRRGSTDWKRAHRPNGFYPIFVNLTDGTIHSVGEPLGLDVPRSSVSPPEGTFAAWPLAPGGGEGRWQVSPTRFRAQLAAGTLVLNSAQPTTGYCSVLYLKSGDLKKIADGDVVVVGREEDGRVILESAADDARRPKTMWVMESHDASTYGTVLLSKLIGDRGFPFPKSLYAVEDALRFFIGDNPEATVLDFFAGSGTTLHAVARLNRQDGGRRRAICITNNEVSAQEAVALTAAGHQPGDDDWEALGICEHITKPRVVSALTGMTTSGTPVNGAYKFVDPGPMSAGFEENAEFFVLTYEDPDLVSLGRKFEAVAPLLWLKAGGVGARIEKTSANWVLPDDAIYGILYNVDDWRGFVDAVIQRAASVDHVFIVTDSEATFQQILSELPTGLPATQLYANYLKTFEINTKGRA